MDFHLLTHQILLGNLNQMGTLEPLAGFLTQHRGGAGWGVRAFKKPPRDPEPTAGHLSCPFLSSRGLLWPGVLLPSRLVSRAFTPSTFPPEVPPTLGQIRKPQPTPSVSPTPVFPSPEQLPVMFIGSNMFKFIFNFTSSAGIYL